MPISSTFGARGTLYKIRQLKGGRSARIIVRRQWNNCLTFVLQRVEWAIEDFYDRLDNRKH